MQLRNRNFSKNQFYQLLFLEKYQKTPTQNQKD